KGPTNVINSVAYFPDGCHIVSASQDKMGIVWDVESGRQDGKRLHHNSIVKSMAISPDGRRIASGTEKGSLDVWDTLTREVVHEIKGDGVYRLAYSPDGRWIVSAPIVDEWVVRLWDADTGRPGREPLKCDGGVYCVKCMSITTDGRKIASGGWDDTVRPGVWDLETRLQVGDSFDAPGWLDSVAFSTDSRYVGGGRDNDVCIFDTESFATQGSVNTFILLQYPFKLSTSVFPAHR
ncbi:WD40 repeat-like protein, partial [Leucogyrophana mollusca]